MERRSPTSLALALTIASMATVALPSDFLFVFFVYNLEQIFGFLEFPYDL
jgi:hypothetical protein